MHKPQAQVKIWHSVFNQTIGTTPEIRDAELRAKIILEEAIETAAALVGTAGAERLLAAEAANLRSAKIEDPNLIEAIDGMCDVLYVVYGTAVACGVDLEPFFDEVHLSNLAKFGGPIRKDGKRLKPPGWRPPDLLAVMRAQAGK